MIKATKEKLVVPAIWCAIQAVTAVFCWYASVDLFCRGREVVCAFMQSFIFLVHVFSPLCILTPP